MPVASRALLLGDPLGDERGEECATRRQTSMQELFPFFDGFQ